MRCKFLFIVVIVVAVVVVVVVELMLLLSLILTYLKRQVSEDFTARAQKYWKEAGVENKVHPYFIHCVLEDLNFENQESESDLYKMAGPLENCSSHRDSSKAGRQQ